MPLQAGEKIRADSGQEAPFQRGMRNTMRNIYADEVGRDWSFTDIHNFFGNVLTICRKERPEYLNALASGREDEGILWGGSPLSARNEEYHTLYLRKMK
ncbi:hypothetical protein ACJMK2_039548 [Sinanodonta woodiana]|uniref:Uncharacterized protein n=1 Tax=Sinanodonta woodiana TaxID=1069815 RepID=A0ABD3WCG7_SINWO